MPTPSSCSVTSQIFVVSSWLRPGLCRWPAQRGAPRRCMNGGLPPPAPTRKRERPVSSVAVDPAGPRRPGPEVASEHGRALPGEDEYHERDLAWPARRSQDEHELTAGPAGLAEFGRFLDLVERADAGDRYDQDALPGQPGAPVPGCGCAAGYLVRGLCQRMSSKRAKSLSLEHMVALLSAAIAASWASVVRLPAVPAARR
jgi:hypothetical protein